MKVCFATIADQRNLPYYEGLKNSLKKFHPDIPLFLWDEPKIKACNDPQLFYRFTPLAGKELLKDFDYVVKIDADSVVTGDLSEAWEGDFDVAVVNNSNPREFKSFPYQYRNIHPFAYANCGFVVMHSLPFVNYWDNTCRSVLFNTQMREQDMLNDLIFDGNWKVKRLDEGDSFWGLSSKGYWANVILKDGKLLLPKDVWPDKDKWIKVIHMAEGNKPNKMNLNNYFQPDVLKHIKGLLHE